MKTTCNNCLDEFDVEPADIQTTTLDDLDIQFIPCPSCGQKFVILAANERMQQLIDERTEIQKKLKIAQAGKYREHTTRKLISQQVKIITEQKKLHAELKPRAEQLLKEAGHGKV